MWNIPSQTDIQKSEITILGISAPEKLKDYVVENYDYDYTTLGMDYFAQYHYFNDDGTIHTYDNIK